LRARRSARGSHSAAAFPSGASPFPPPRLSHWPHGTIACCARPVA
jgi:hypothetical protein